MGNDQIHPVHWSCWWWWGGLECHQGYHWCAEPPPCHELGSTHNFIGCNLGHSQQPGRPHVRISPKQVHAHKSVSIATCRHLTSGHPLSIIFATFNETMGSIKPPILMDTTEEIVAMDSTTTQISSLSSAIDNLLDIVSSEQDFISQHAQCPSNLSMLSKWLCMQGIFQMRLLRHSWTPRKNWVWHSIPYTSHEKTGQQTEDSSLHNTELLLRDAWENLPKVDTTININTSVLPQTRLFVCSNMVLLCHTFVQVHSTSTVNNSIHHTPSLFTAAMKLGDIITLQSLQGATLGSSKQTILVLYMTLLLCVLGKKHQTRSLVAFHISTICCSQQSPKHNSTTAWKYSY